MAKFQGFSIHQNEDGFYWQKGGYFDTIEECRADIAHWNHGEIITAQREGLIPVDTPCLEPPWWSCP
jgi:hypothetical protein